MKIRLPHELETRFHKLRQLLLKVQSTETILAIFVCLSTSFLVVFVSDRIADTASSIRLAILILSFLLAGMMLVRWGFRWVISPPGIKSLAMLVQRRYRQLGDGLLGIVELADESARPENFSEELYEAAIEQIATDALHYDFEKAVSRRFQRRLFVATASLILVFLLLSILVPGATANAFSRWAVPYGEIPRYTLVRIQDLKFTDVIVFGEPFEVNAKVNYMSFWKPNSVVAKFQNDEDEPLLEAEVDEGMIRMMVPGQHESGILQITLGDRSETLKIDPVFRPKLIRIDAELRLPKYLKYPNEDRKIAGGILEILEGSKMILKGEISRKLESASLHLGASVVKKMKIEGREFETDLIDLADQYEANLRWKDHIGLTNSGPWEFEISHISDQAPNIDLPDLGTDTAILDSEVLVLRVITQDDFGVNEFGLNWQASNGKKPSSEMLQREFYDASLNSSQKELDVNFYFSPALYEIPAGETVIFKGFVSDFFPNRPPTESAIYKVHIVSSAEHAEMIRTRLESLLTHLEEIARLQEKLAEASGTIQKDPELASAVIEDRLQDQLEDQTMNAIHLEQLARQGLGLLSEAMRNSKFSDEMMQEWTETLFEMQSLSEKKMADASRFLSTAKKNSANSASRSRNLSSANEVQKEILESLTEMQKEVNRDLDGMEAMTLAQRLRALGTGQRDVEEALMKQAAETIGLFPNELAPRFQASNDALSEKQKKAGEESQLLQEEISRFYERTQRDEYGEVSKAMKEDGLVDELIKIESLIQKNISMQATEALANWGRQFDDWAKVLEPPPSDDPSGGGGGGGGGESQLDLTKHLIALLRLRESELTLRAQTRLLQGRKIEDHDDHKDQIQNRIDDRIDDQSEMRIDDHDDHKDQIDDRIVEDRFDDQVGELSLTQVKIQDRLAEVSLENPLPDLDQILDEAHIEMDRVLEFLSQNETGEATIQVETRAINAITDGINLINEQAQRRGSSASSMAEQMALMMQMATMKRGQSISQTPSGSGNSSGGETDRSATERDGERSGTSEKSRGVLRGSGRSEDLPTEFRHIFEHYYRELERLESTLPIPTKREDDER